MRTFLAFLKRIFTRRQPRPAPPAPAPTPVPTPVPEPSPEPPPAPVPLPVGASEPTFIPGAHRLLLADDFTTGTEADLYRRYTMMDGENGIHLDPTGGTDGTPALRIDWTPRSGCDDDSHLIEKGWPDPPREIVASWTCRYTPGFAFDWTGRGGSCHGNAKKLFFLWAGSGSRFMLICENGTLGVGSDYDHPLLQQNVGRLVTPQELADGRWHRITLRVRQSSAPDATDGAIDGWVDGVKRWSHLAVASRASGGWGLFKMPTTLNTGSPQAQSEWIDSVTLFVP